MHYIITYSKDWTTPTDVETFCLYNAKSVREAVDRFEKANPDTTIIAVRERKKGEEIY